MFVEIHICKTLSRTSHMKQALVWFLAATNG